MIRVKICGITRAEDAVLAAELGAHALGFVFHPPSPRYVTVEQVRSIVAQVPPFVTTVGVFVNRPMNAIATTLRETGLHVAQLHGDESPEEVRQATFPAYKAFRVGSEFDLGLLARFPGLHAFLLDTQSREAYGGTGETFDWRVAREARAFGPIILAGGLHAGNVEEAVRVGQPAAIDVSSGVERSPGIKDASRLRELFEVVRKMGVGS